MIKNLDEYIQMTGKVYKDHNLTMRKWSKNNKQQYNKPVELTDEERRAETRKKIEEARRINNAT